LFRILLDFSGASQLDSIEFGLILVFAQLLDKLLSSSVVLIEDADAEAALREPCHNGVADSTRVPSHYRNLVCHGFTLLSKQTFQSPHNAAAVDDHRLAGDEVGSIACQEHRSAYQVFGLADSA
jgi:hypothetical protein